MKSNRRDLMVATALATMLPVAARADRNDLGQPRVVEGPMMGPVGPDKASIWLRLSGDYFDAFIEYAEDPDDGPWLKTPSFRADAVDDFCVTVGIEGLKPATQYYYRLVVNGGRDRYLKNFPPFPFRTAPDGPARFRVAFGSCARIQSDPLQPVWLVMEDWRPDLLLWLGDNIYGDSLDVEMLANEYRRQRFVASYQTIGRSVPQLAIWDDHDFGLDGYDRTSPVKDQSLSIFKNYWANPAYGLAETPGVFFAHAHGGVDFFFLDGRYHRSPSTDDDGPDKTMLGAGQFDWLCGQLSRSTAPFKIISCGTGWSGQQGAHGDSWSGYLTERDRLFDFMRDEAVTGVILLSGDTHFPQVTCIPRSEQGGYDLYNLVSSALAQQVEFELSAPIDIRRRLGSDKLIRNPVFGVNNFGVLDFDLTIEDPELRFNIVTSWGKILYEPLVLRASDLQNGVVSWSMK